MADEDDQWLYGDSTNPEAPEDENEADNKVSEPPEESLNQESESQLPSGEEPANDESTQEPPPPGGTGEDDGEKEPQNGEGSEKEDSDEDSDDDVNVVIGDIKTSPAYASLNIKRGGLLTSTAGGDKLKQPGKFSIDEFESVGSINGVPAQEYNLDNLEDKPWRKPGADITDYFNYGFNEDTWRAYCERQKRLRINESGVGVAPMNSIGMPRSATSITNDNSKYSGNLAGPRKAGPPPGRRMMGSIDVIGGNSGLASRRGTEAPTKVTHPKENVIQVMTADRREYSRKPGFPDMSVPPPPASFQDFQPEFGFNPEPEPYYGGYEPTQDCQWGTEPTWTPSEIKELTPGPITPVQVLPPVVTTPVLSQPGTPPIKEDSPTPSIRETSRSRSEKPRDSERERSHRKERSRSRSRRHKSRSRSPSHRSHRKKKSRRHDDSD